MSQREMRSLDKTPFPGKAREGMEKALLHMMRCLKCGADGLRVSCGSMEQAEEGPIVCTACGRAYQVRNGIIDFLVDPSPEVARERGAFQSFLPVEPSVSVGWEEHRRIILALPMLEGYALPAGDLETWRRHGREAFGICEGLDFRGLRVLELGAGRCWFSAHFARLGAEAVAVDILEDEVMGLGCGRFFEEEEGLRIHRVLCDMHSLPFREGSFDVVAATATLHHSPDLSALLSEARRVLKPGGLLLAANEPLYLPWRETPEEERKGAHEGSFPLWTWMRLLHRAGFRLAEVRAAEGLLASLAFRAVKEEGGWTWPPGLLKGMSRYVALLALSPLLALRRGARSWAAGRPMLPLPERELAYLRARLYGKGLEAEARVDNPAHWGPGWYPPEQPAGQEAPFRWSGPRSLLLLPPPRRSGSLVMELATFHPSPWSQPVEVEIRVGGRKLGEARIGRHGWQTYLFDLSSLKAGRPAKIHLRVRKGWFRPSEWGLGGDSRLLGVACRSARWE